MEIFEQKEKRRRQMEAKKRIAGIKAAAMRAPAKPWTDSDDEFDIYHDSPRSKPTPVLVQIDGRRKYPDAKAVLNKTSAKPMVSKQRQAMLRRAGKTARPKEDVTETYIDFAGKAFKHAELKKSNAGAVPVGQKKGRDNLISQAQMDAMIKAKHQQQIATLQRQKEEEWGRIRALPKREQQDMTAILEMTAKAAAEVRKESEDEEDEDYAFVSEGENEDEEARMEYSGEESEVQNGSDEDVDEGSETASTGKENRPAEIAERVEMDEEELAPVIRRKPRTSNRVAFDSDDEGDTTMRAPPLRAPLVEVPIRQVVNPVACEVDIGGFEAASGSFSQLFEATQSANQPTANVSPFCSNRSLLMILSGRLCSTT